MAKALHFFGTALYSHAPIATPSAEFDIFGEVDTFCMQSLYQSMSIVFSGGKVISNEAGYSRLASLRARETDSPSRNGK